MHTPGWVPPTPWSRWYPAQVSAREIGAHLLGEDTGPVKAGMCAFDRVMLQCNIEKVLPAYKLAKTAEEFFQNLHLSKMALVEAGLDELGDWPEIEWGRPLRLRSTKQVGVRCGLSLHRSNNCCYASGHQI